ncbi:class I SAM-dependent methyltransferase [Lachnospiraceae bacterium]|nr:class I SAM-dependent methyltransferase [Lachnospiraceae bacterium]
MNRNSTNKINYFLDNWMPPVLRDCKFFMRILLRIGIGKKYSYYMDFKKRLPTLKETDINKYYRVLADTFIKRETDLNKACIERILSEEMGEIILDAAAGKGFMAGRILNNYPEKIVTVSDIVLPPFSERIDGIKYVKASLTKMPFEDKTFDTVICTHALEHIKDIQGALSELRRVCRNKLIIVLPRQREYLYTFDLHINFFPYKYNVENILNNSATIELLDNDWYCVEYI